MESSGGIDRGINLEVSKRLDSSNKSESFEIMSSFQRMRPSQRGLIKRRKVVLPKCLKCVNVYNMHLIYNPRHQRYF